MNKTVTINISGIIFHIEEDAYDTLSKYLSTIKSYFSQTDGRDEIMADIEARIAEMLQQKVNNYKQVIVMADVEHVIEVMGKAETFAGEEQANAKASQQTSAPLVNGRHRSRVFRDEDEKLLGGVCAGLAAYFDVDVVWVRLGFVIAASLFGSSIFLYIILWIIIPPARTSADKLEMRGEKVNVDNIGRVVQEEMSNFKKKMSDFAEEVNQFGQEASTKQFRERTNKTAHAFGSLMVDIVGKFFSLFAKLIAGGMAIVGLAMLMSVIGILFAVSTNLGGLRDLGNMVFVDREQFNYAIIGVSLVFGIPFSLLLYKGIRLMFGSKKRNPYVGFIASALWLMSIVLCGYVAYYLASSMAEEAFVKEIVQLKNPKSNVLYLRGAAEPSDNENLIELNNRHHHESSLRVFRSRTDSNKVLIGSKDISLNIVSSKDDTFALVVTRNAKGFDHRNASENAEKIIYAVLQKDSVLVFDPEFFISVGQKLRCQEIKMVLRVPQNKSVFIERSMENLIDDIENVSHTDDYDMLGKQWVMTVDGLKEEILQVEAGK